LERTLDRIRDKTLVLTIVIRYSIKISHVSRKDKKKKEEGLRKKDGSDSYILQ
jgi:hypothetical protein